MIFRGWAIPGNSGQSESAIPCSICQTSPAALFTSAVQAAEINHLHYQRRPCAGLSRKVKRPRPKPGARSRIDEKSFPRDDFPAASRCAVFASVQTKADMKEKP